MDFRSFMLGGVDGELNFLLAEGASEGQNSPSAKSVNNNAPMINATPLSFVYRSNVVDFNDPSYGEDEQTLVGPFLSLHPEASKKFKILSKRKVASGVPRKALPLTALVRGSCFWCSWCSWCSWEGLAFESLKRSRELISILYKAKTSYDVIRARELDKDRAYAELERKYNEALKDLDKNPLVSDMRAEIKALQGQVDGLPSEYNMLILEEKNSLKQYRAAVVYKVIPDAAMKLIRSDDLDVLIAKLVRSSIIYGRCQAFEEFAAMEDPFVLEKISGYRPSLKEEYDQVGDALANASYPFLAEYVAHAYASLEQLLSKKSPLLR
uniref:Uncharacterized protein n=1 Tax=Tanacetum cinerariifolium TaxID=118510 RepID=A0A699H8N2_TANCI|nr:hypothetical protein [Tanacetum cinerariifolium]